MDQYMSTYVTKYKQVAKWYIQYNATKYENMQKIQ